MRTFKRKEHLKQHQSRINPCFAGEDDQKPITCVCGQKLSSRSSLSRHKKTCPGPQKKSLREEVDDLKIEVERLKSRPEASSSNDTHINNSTNTIDYSNHSQNTTNNDNSQNIHIHINNYGREQTGYLDALTFEQLKDILQLTPDNESILKMLAFIHKNPEHPENHNLKLKDVEDEKMEVYKKGDWKEVGTDKTMFDVISRQCLRFLDIEEKLKKGMTKAKYDALARYLDDAEGMTISKDVKQHPEHSFDELMDRAKERVAT